MLANAERERCIQPLPLIVDRLGIKRQGATADAPELALTELHNAAGQRLIARLVRRPPSVPSTVQGTNP